MEAGASSSGRRQKGYRMCAEHCGFREGDGSRTRQNSQRASLARRRAGDAALKLMRTVLLNLLALRRLQGLRGGRAAQYFVECVDGRTRHALVNLPACQLEEHCPDLRWRPLPFARLPRSFSNDSQETHHLTIYALSAHFISQNSQAASSWAASVARRTVVSSFSTSSGLLRKPSAPCLKQAFCVSTPSSELTT